MRPKTQNIINKIIISEMFDNFAIFPILDFWESAKFNKNKDWQGINWFTKHFADIFRVQKWPTFYIETIVQGAAMAQSLQGFIRSALFPIPRGWDFFWYVYFMQRFLSKTEWIDTPERSYALDPHQRSFDDCM